MNTSYLKLVVTVLSILVVSSAANAATKGRIIPNGSVTFEKNGITSTYKEQTAIDDEALIACSGNCMAKLQGLSLIAADETEFAVKEINGSIHLYVASGLINFTLTNTSKQIAFYGPGGQYVMSDGFITPASTTSAVSGYMKVSESEAVVGMEKGSMVLTTADGLQTVSEGKAFQLALADLPGGTAGEGGKDRAAAVAQLGSGSGAGGGAGAGAGGGAGSGGVIGGGLIGGAIITGEAIALTANMAEAASNKGSRVGSPNQ